MAETLEEQMTQYMARQTMWDLWIHVMPGVEWAYGNLLDSRDINSHDISWRWNGRWRREC